MENELGAEDAPLLFWPPKFCDQVMGRHHLVRVGALGQVGRFTAVDLTSYPRHARVVLRTSRGLELGEVLSPPGDEEHPERGDGSILRGVTIEDQLLSARLEQNRQAAVAACETLLRERALPAVLMDVEHLFDGRTLWFYFLGEVTPELATLTEQLAELYETQVHFRRFAETLSEGCGPGCGSEDAAGQGCQSCGTGCAIAGACGTRKPTTPGRG
jgi:PSP1 C-terminal conserved region